METSILKSTKKILGVADHYDVFDLDILTHINAAFAIVNQLGVGPEDSVIIDDDTTTWDDLGLPPDQLGVIKTYIFLRVRALFDPPSTSFLVSAINDQITEYEMRLSYMRENALPTPVTPP